MQWLNSKLESFVDNSVFLKSKLPGLSHLYTSLGRSWLVAGLSQPSFDPRPVDVRFLVDELTLMHDFSKLFGFSLSYYFTSAPSTLFIHEPSSLCSLISAIGGNVKWNIFCVIVAALGQHWRRWVALNYYLLISKKIMKFYRWQWKIAEFLFNCKPDYFQKHRLLVNGNFVMACFGPASWQVEAQQRSNQQIYHLFFLRCCILHSEFPKLSSSIYFFLRLLETNYIPGCLYIK
jgi:hypothetical protein